MSEMPKAGTYFARGGPDRGAQGHLPVGSPLRASNKGQGMDLFQISRERMIREQLVPRGIQDARVLDAMRTVPRHLFVAEALHAQANPLRTDCAGRSKQQRACKPQRVDTPPET